MEEETPSRKRPRTRSDDYSGTPPAERSPGRDGIFNSDEGSQNGSPPPLPGLAARNENDNTAQIPPGIDDTMDEGPVSLIDLTTATRRPKVQPYSNWNEYLKEIFDDLGTQSTILKEHISGKISGMLNLLTEVNQKELTRDRRALPVESPNGTVKTFIPSQHRTKPSMQASKLCADDPEMIAFLEESGKADELDRERRARDEQKKGELEIKIRLKKLRKNIGELACDISAYGIIVTSQLTREERLALDGVQPHVLKEQERIFLVARELLSSLTDEDAEYLGDTSTKAMVQQFETNYNFDVNAAITKLKGDGGEHSMRQVQSILVEWKALFPKLTMNVFKLADQLATVNKGVKMGADTLKKRKTEKATKDTQAALDEVDESTGLSASF